MKIGFNNNIAFSGVYVNDVGMSKEAVNKLQNIKSMLEYDEDSVANRLDKQGVDILLNGYKQQSYEHYRVVFSDSKGHCFIMLENGLSYLDFYARNGGSKNKLEYSFNLRNVKDIENIGEQILEGKLEKTKKPSEALNLAFPARDNILNARKFPYKNYLSFDEEDSLMSEEYEKLVAEYGDLDVMA